jgi:site-specific DNA-methyltransferase (adenine-specific)
MTVRVECWRLNRYVGIDLPRNPVPDVQLHLGDCLEVMKTIPDGSIDMILADLPYGTTACKWDTVIPFAPLWEQYERVIRKNGAIVLTASQPFTASLLMSNPSKFRHRWVWDNVKPSTGLHAKVMPLQVAEDILVFSMDAPTYYPQMTVRGRRREWKNDSNGEAFGGKRVVRLHDNLGVGYPKNLLQMSNADQTGRVHPTQKPVALMEYLIRTYTIDGETVLDNTMGSGTTGVACVNTDRNFIGIELDATYFAIAEKRIADAQERRDNESQQNQLPLAA